VELLVVIAVIAILISLTVPSLSGAREAAHSAIAMANVRRLGVAQISYANQHGQWIAGPNTSGARAILDHGRSLEGDTSSTTPTTTHDWISPVLGDEMGFSPNRAERTAQIFGRLAGPRVRRTADTLWGRADDLGDFERVLDERGFLQVSYLSPAAFHYRPEGGAWTPRLLRGSSGRPLTGIPRPYHPPSSYRPRLDLLARPDAKALVADGTRYVTEQLGPKGSGFTLDFDVSPEPTIYGSFTSSGPIFHSSRAYGRAYLSGGDVNVSLSMRYYGHEMHVGYFDTHAERLGAGRVWSDPTAWYPRGSRYEGGDVTPEVAGLFAAQPARYGRVD
jgi:type II secretory pathway pseudopilin PulG